jgi:type IV pilus assembly protein PilB
MRATKSMGKRKLGEVLRERGQISAKDLSDAVSDQPRKLVRLGELLLERELVTKEDLSSALEEVTHVPYLNCASVQPTGEALKAISRTVAERCCALPVELKNQRLTVIMANPQDLSLLNDLSFTSGANIEVRFGFRKEIVDGIAKYYEKTVRDPLELQRENGTTEEPGDESGQIEFFSMSSRQATKDAFQEVQEELLNKRTPAVRVVSEVIQAAVEREASDIHIEPQEDETVVRLRVDGVLRDLQRVPRALQNSLASRIKILSDMDIAERRAPQDGRFMVSLRGRQMDVRVSTLPTQYGEKVVMRLLDSQADPPTFAHLGLPAGLERDLLRLLALPQGMVLVTGPTGSGKSTTLYAALNVLRKPSVNIITVEDPVEYVLPGINQVHVNVRAGLTFASCLRSILRQDPNVIMLGEIRDRETAEIVMKASQTGHMVLSTLHTNDSISAIVRLLDLEVQAYLIAASLTGIMAQRLIRKLCICRTEAVASAAFRTRLAEMGFTEPVQTEWTPGACDLCGRTGFHGRVGVYELLVVDEAVRTAIREGCKIDAIRRAASTRGFKLMQEDAFDKVRDGITTIDEVMRIVPLEALGVATECGSCGRTLGPAFQFCPFCGASRVAEGEAPKKGTTTAELIGKGGARR